MLASWCSRMEAALLTRYECALSQDSTCPDITLDVVSTFTLCMIMCPYTYDEMSFLYIHLFFKSDHQSCVYEHATVMYDDVPFGIDYVSSLSDQVCIVSDFRSEPMYLISVSRACRVWPLVHSFCLV